jgi:hypothetical protein
MPPGRLLLRPLSSGLLFYTRLQSSHLFGHPRNTTLLSLTSVLAVVVELFGGGDRNRTDE